MTNPTDDDLMYAPAEPTVRVHATYPAVPWACPESVSLDLFAPADSLAGAIYAAIDAVARVPGYAQLARDEAARASDMRR